MLNINLTANVEPKLRQLVVELNRTHVSRFPILVENREDVPHVVKFVDSRFPKNAYMLESCIAMLSYENKFVIESRKIQNEKYRPNHDGYYSNTTSDPKKMLKLLKQYIKPRSVVDIAGSSNYTLSRNQEIWVNEPRDDFIMLVGSVSSEDVAAEITLLKTAGVEFHTDKFKKIATQGLELQAEANRRKALPGLRKHVFINPDGTVDVNRIVDPNKPPEGGTYYTFEEVPETIQQAVAMLRMVDNGVFVPEVGMRVSGREFWVLE